MLNIFWLRGADTHSWLLAHSNTLLAHTCICEFGEWQLFLLFSSRISSRIFVALLPFSNYFAPRFSLCVYIHLLFYYVRVCVCVTVVVFFLSSIFVEFFVCWVKTNSRSSLFLLLLLPLLHSSYNQLSWFWIFYLIFTHAYHRWRQH